MTEIENVRQRPDPEVCVKLLQQAQLQTEEFCKETKQNQSSMKETICIHINDVGTLSVEELRTLSRCRLAETTRTAVIEEKARL